MQIHFPALVQLENCSVVKLSLEVVRVRRHQISTQVDVLEHSFQLGRERTSALRLMQRKKSTHTCTKKQTEECGAKVLYFVHHVQQHGMIDPVALIRRHM